MNLVAEGWESKKDKSKSGQNVKEMENLYIVAHVNLLDILLLSFVSGRRVNS